MSALATKIRKVIRRHSSIDRAHMLQAMLFVVPAIAIIVSSYLLVLVVKHFTYHELHQFSTTLLLAVIFSLIGTAAIQAAVSKVLGDAGYLKDKPMMTNGIRSGMAHIIVFCLVASTVAYPLFDRVLGFPTSYYAIFVVLLVLFSLSWMFLAALWSTGNNKYPAVACACSYFAAFGLSFALSPSGALPAMAGYAAGIAMLLLLLALAATRVFGKWYTEISRLKELALIPKIIWRNGYMALFQTLYFLALFLDKIVVWTVQGLDTQQGLLLLGPYSKGAFWGLIPLLSIAGVAYFSAKAKPLLDEFYEGTLYEIETRIGKYKQLYNRCLAASLIIAVILCAATIAFGLQFFKESEAMEVLVTTSLASVFFLGIAFNSSSLSLFKRFDLAMFSVLIVCMVELYAALFASTNIVALSYGFLVGSCLGFAASHLMVRSLFNRYCYNMFCNLA